MADGEVALERRERAVVEDVGDEAHVLDDVDVLAVAHGHARRLLAAVLQGVEAEIGQVGDGLARRIDAEDPACLAPRPRPYPRFNAAGSLSRHARVWRPRATRRADPPHETLTAGPAEPATATPAAVALAVTLVTFAGSTHSTTRDGDSANSAT